VKLKPKDKENEKMTLINKKMLLGQNIYQIISVQEKAKTIE